MDTMTNTSLKDAMYALSLAKSFPNAELVDRIVQQ